MGKNNKLKNKNRNLDQNNNKKEGNNDNEIKNSKSSDSNSYSNSDSDSNSNSNNDSGSDDKFNNKNVNTKGNTKGNTNQRVQNFNPKLKSNTFAGFLMDSDSEENSENDEDNGEDNSDDSSVKSQKLIQNNSKNKIIDEKEKINKNEVTKVTKVTEVTEVKDEKNKKNLEHLEKIESKKDLKDGKKQNKDNKKILKQELKKQNKKNNHNEIDKGKSNIFVENIELEVAGKILIHESNLVINTNTTYCLIGSNGAGKSSLAKYIYEKIKDTEDVLLINQHIHIENEEETVYEYVLKANEEMHDKYLELLKLEEKEELDNRELILYEELSEYLTMNEWDKFNAEAKKILYGMGFEDINKKIKNFSGGWQVRSNICRSLLRCPRLLILDEISNFLDLETNIWLTNYLETYPKSLILITHEIDLVNSISHIIWYVGNLDLTGTKIHTIRGNYGNFIKKRDEINEDLQKKYKEFEKKVKGLRNKSTLKKEVDEFIKKGPLRPPREYKVKIEFDNIVSPGSDRIIQLNDVDFSYDNNEIFKKLNFTVNMNSRIIICGKNGTGKSTFFKLMSEKIFPKDGYIIKDDRLRIGYYHQLITDNLPMNLTPIEYLQSLDGKLNDGDCRGILGKISIKKTDQNLDLPKTQINKLSGGQKLRCALASIQMKKPHLILLDEVSAHMDVESINGLIEGINNFNGGIVLISHDLYLIKNIKNAEIYELKSKNLVKFNGEFDNYIDYILSEN